MSSPLPSEASTLPVLIKNALSKLWKNFNKERLHMDQQQSPLMRLPLEARMIIWQYVLGGNKIEPRFEPSVGVWRTMI